MSARQAGSFPIRLGLPVVIILLVSSTTVWAMAQPVASSTPYESLTIIHTNDIHGHFIPSRATWLGGDPSPRVGGVASYARFLRKEIDQAQREDRGILVIDSADWFTGTPESDLSGGRAMITSLNQLPLDFTTLGNHEFDVGVSNLIERIDDLEVPVLASNVRYQFDTRPFPGTQDTAVIERQGVQIGLFGLLLDEMPEITTPKSIEGTIFRDEANVSEEMIEQLEKAGAELVIALTHMGIEKDRELARSVDGIDIIVGSHSHTRLSRPERVDGTLILQAGSNLTSAGRLDLDLSYDGEILRYRGGLVSLLHQRFPPVAEVQQAVQPYIDKAREKLSRVVGRTTAPVERDSSRSSPLGNLITDAMREYAGVDLAFQNAFGIRDNLPEGTITVRELHSVLPFGNELVEMNLTGEQLKQVFEQSATMDKGLLQFSGGIVELDRSRTKGKRVRAIKVNGELLEPQANYRVVTNSFLAEGGDRFTTFVEGTDRHRYSGTTLKDVLRGWFTQYKTIEPPAEDRYRF